MSETIKMPTDKRSGLVKRAANASVVTSFLLIFAKIIAFILTGSIAILATAVDSCIDLLASFINMIAVKQAAVPADKEHRFGHGKFESLAALAQSAFIFGSGLILLLTAAENYSKSYRLNNLEAGLAVMIFSIVATLLLISLQTYVIRKTASVAIEADRAHYSGDLAVNLSVIISLFLNYFFEIGFLDAVFAVLIAIYLMFTATKIFIKSCAMLTDTEISDDERKKILDTILNNKSVIRVYDLRTRSSGSKLFIQCTLEMDGKLTLNESHFICDLIERDINIIFPEAEVFIHQCPADTGYINNRTNGKD